MRRLAFSFAAALAVAVPSGCGGGDDAAVPEPVVPGQTLPTATGPRPAGTTTAAAPEERTTPARTGTAPARERTTPARTQPAAPRTPAAVMRAWERAVTGGRAEEAARLFADGAKVPEGVLDSHDTAVAWNHSVVCWGKIDSLNATRARVRMTLVVGRPRNVACPPRGTRLKVAAEVRNGKIVSWQYVLK